MAKCLALAFVALLIVLAILPAGPFETFEQLRRGNIDLLSFWSAFQLFGSGANPYDPALLRELQQARGLGAEPVKLTWNPPWFFVLFCPVLLFPLGKATVGMLGVNLLVTAGLARLSLARPSAQNFVRAFALAILFYPTLQTLGFGQSSLVLTALAAGTIWAAHERRDVAAGICFALLSIKPHLLLGFIVVFLIWILVEQRFRILAAACVTFAGLVLVTAFFNPAAFTNWLRVFSGGGSALGVSDWQTATLCSALRSVLAGTPAWLIPAFVLLSVGLSVLVFARLRGRVAVDELFALILLVSVAASPYGWVFDFSLLLIPLLVVFRRACESGNGRRAFLAIAVCEVFFLPLASALKEQQQFFFFPLLFSVGCYVVWRAYGRHPSEN